jgi:Glycosyl hydrolases family 2, TIM barrel domain/Glycosyl hydrolases family 2, sugar binding domain/Glycosyl hydrolases family 2/Beta galactosidase small chain
MSFSQRIISILFCLVSSSYIYSQPTEIIYLSGTDADNTVKWDFYCTDGQNSGKWTKIDVPSNWELEGFGNYNYGHDWKNNEIKLGKEHGIYKYEFKVPATWKGKTVNIVFDGSMTDTRVKINGKSAGEMHQGAFYRFKYDISDLLKYGKSNLLEVDVAKHSTNESVNRAERQADFWIFGGIFRPVFLEILPETHLNRTAINARTDGSFNALLVVNKSESDYKVSVDLYDLEGKKVGKTKQFRLTKGIKELTISGKFEGVKSWNPEWPNLYKMKISLKADDQVLHEVTERIGFRTVELRNHDGFYINKEKVVFKGVNRHSFWPETGRCLSEDNILKDILLIKEMNMNAVRCSHYVPDKRFLDLCDSLGLFVLDEVTGWQDAYDTIVGLKLIKETVLKDENHPSVVIWDHGNEGGWDFANEKWFHLTDIQKRPVICPWMLHNGVDTHHYPEFEYAIQRFKFGNAPFMATELLHGLYDGGHGAGLEDYWRNYESSPLFAGGFLWDLADEAVLRTDMEGLVFDADENHAPDGILGPHHEKEASFYSIKEIWSPVQIEPVIINKQWNGKLFLENKFIYTNLKDCSFSWKALKTFIASCETEVCGSGVIQSPEAEPGETAMIQMDNIEALQSADIFQFTAKNQYGQELYTWSWPIVQALEKAKELKRSLEGEIEVQENENSVIAQVNGLELTFSKNDGTIQQVSNKNGKISLTGGPFPVGLDSKIIGVEWRGDPEGNFVLITTRNNYPEKIKWTVYKDGMLYLEVDPLSKALKDIDFVGVSFYYPEEKCLAVKWMGSGPFRVWKNRIKGSNFGVWEKEYNNTITGESFNKLIYPEFKGYHGNLYWMTLETKEQPFTIISETPNLYFQLFIPDKPKFSAGGTFPPFPGGDISFLYEIPAIGTKFKQVEALGPGSQKGIYKGHAGDENDPLKLWFDFRSK